MTKMSSNNRNNQNSTRNRHTNRPYERPSSNSNGDNNNAKGLLSHMKASVSELLSHSWIPTFLRYNAVPNNSHGLNPERESVIDSFMPSPNSSGLQIYPEEGTSGPSTSNINKPVLAFKQNNLEKYKSSNMIPEPLVTSTPSGNFMDRAVIIDKSANANVDFSIRTPNNTNQLDLSEPSTSQTPTTNLPCRNTVSKKRLRDSFNDSSFQLSNSSFQNKSLPQASALSNKRPRFNASTYGSSVNTSNALAESSFSIFYPGKTMYGGAANYRKPKCLSPLKSLQRSQIRPQPAIEQIDEEAGLSVAAKRILNCLENMSTPLSEAKKMPLDKGKVDYFDGPYISDFHKHRPSLRTESPRTPPVSNLQTPAKSNTKENLAAFLKKQGTLTSYASSLHKLTSPTTMTPQGTRALEKDIISPNTALALQGIVSSEKIVRNAITSFTPHVTKSSEKGIFSKQTVNKAPTKLVEEVDQHINERPVKIVQDSYKITSKKGVPQFDDSPLIVPDLPNISLPLTTLPTISFNSIMPTDPFIGDTIRNKENLSLKFPVKKDDEVSSFHFSTPEVLQDSAVKTDSVDTVFVFSKPQSENNASLGTKSAEQSNLSDISKKSSASLNGFESFNWVDKSKSASNFWECNTCCVKNKNSDNKCVACHTANLKCAKTMPISSSKPDVAGTIFSEKSVKDIAVREAEIAPKINGFGSMFGKKDSQWTCNMCLIHNDKDSDSCVACSTTRPDSAASQSKSNFSSFGSEFFMPKNEWECDVCLVRNKECRKKCDSCGSVHPSLKNVDPNSEEIATGFSFTSSLQSKDSDKISSNAPSSQVASSFKFGVSSTTEPQPSSGSFIFGVSSASDTSSIGKFNFGVSTSTIKSDNLQFNFGANASTTKSDISNFNAGSKVAASIKPAIELKFSKGNNKDSDKKSAFSGFGSPFSADKSDWECNSCLVRNKEINDKCVACQSLRNSKNNTVSKIGQATEFTFGNSKTTEDSSKQKSAVSLVTEKTIGVETGNFIFGNNSSKTQPTTAALAFGTSTLPAKSSSDIFNFGSNNLTGTSTSGTFNFGSKSTNESKLESNKIVPAKNNDIGFGTPFSMEKSDWECNSCLVRNKTSSNKCVACHALKSSKNIDNNSISTGFNFDTKPKEDSSSKINSIPAFGKGGTTSDNNFGSNITTTQSNLFQFGPNNVPKPNNPTFNFGSNKSTTAPNSSIFNFGSNTSTTASNSGTFNFGSNTSTTASNSGTFNFGSNTATAPSNSGVFNFGSTTSEKTGSMEMKFGSNASDTQSSKIDFQFGSSTKSASNELFGTKLNTEKTNNNDPSTFSWGNKFNPSPFDAGSLANPVHSKFPSVQPYNMMTPEPEQNGLRFPPSNPFDAAPSSVGPAKTVSRIIKKAVRRTRK